MNDPITPGKISVIVIDITRDNQQLPGATVTLLGSYIGNPVGITNGQTPVVFQNVNPGPYAVSAVMPGYSSMQNQQVQVPANGTVPLVFQCSPVNT